MSDLKTVVRNAIQTVAEAMAAAGETELREVVKVGDLKLVLKVEMPKPKSPKSGDTGQDLPQKIRAEPKAVKKVYRFVRDYRTNSESAKVKLGPLDIWQGIKKQTPKEAPAIRTVHRSLKRLRVLGFVYSDKLGYRLGEVQPALPFCESAADGTSKAEELA